MPSLAEFEKEFFTYAEMNYAIRSRYIFRVVLNNLRTIVSEVPLTNLNMRVIDKYKTKRLAEVTGVTVNVELHSLRTMMNIAVRWGMLEKNPFSGLKLVSIAEKAPRFLTLEEYKSIYNSIQEEWLRNVVLFAVMTGARRAEIVYLRWSDIDLNRKEASFESRGGFRMKAGKRRTIPLNDEVCALLTSLKSKSQCDYVFTFRNSRIEEGIITHRFKRYARRVGLGEGVQFHCLRATFASWIVMKGVPIYSVSKLLGHSNVSTTQKYYAHLEPDSLHSVVEKIVI